MIQENKKIKNNDNLKNITRDIDIPILGKNRKKIADKDFQIPTFSQYDWLIKNDYKVVQLREISAFYKQKKTGTKPQLLKSLYNFLFFSHKLIKIQAAGRGRLVKKYVSLHGPAYINRKLCVNETDFYTLEELETIDPFQFISYKDSDNFIYGFDICSLNQYIINQLDSPGGCKKIINPYTRSELPKKIFKYIKSLKRLSRILNIPIKLTIEQDIICPKKQLELRILKIFQRMDELGNYTESAWFGTLRRNELVKFTRELHDIWNFRLNLTSDTKYNICPQGDPFRHINLLNIITIPIEVLKKMVISIIENFIFSGNTEEYQSLGCIYVLTALTLVNNNAAESLPWLFQSVAPINLPS